MKKYLGLALILLLSSACSNLSKNFVRHGEFEISSGKAGNTQWEDDLVFQRFSWYKELTLVYDILAVRIDKNSPYYNWFSQAEKEAMARCKDSFVAVTYAQDDEKISKQDMIDQFKDQAHSRFALREFKRNLKMHPDYEMLRLQLYKVDGICQESFEKKDLSLTFPGFKAQTIKI